MVTLLPGQEGYTVSLTGPGGETELARLGYDDTALLDSIDREELPVVLLDLLAELAEQEHDLFHGGAVVCEVRDSRRGRTRRDLVLLRPTTQSIICDSLALSRAGRWSSQDRANLESQVSRILAAAQSLILTRKI